MFHGKEEDGGMTVMAAHNDSVICFGLLLLMKFWMDEVVAEVNGDLSFFFSFF